MKVSVIITTYNAVEWLQKVLIGYSVQTECDFEIVIADDGSTSETKDLISQFSTKFTNPIVHVWHEDHVFQKTKNITLPDFQRLPYKDAIKYYGTDEDDVKN